MASFYCKCGERLSNSDIPNDIQLWVYSDKEWDVILEKDTFEAWKVPLPTYDVWRCPNCERIYAFDNENKLFKTYVLEE